MANNKGLISDLFGVFRGLYIIHSHAAQLPTQRTLTLQRSLTPNQRSDIQHEWEQKRHQQELMEEHHNHEQTLAEVKQEHDTIPQQAVVQPVQQIVEPVIQPKIIEEIKIPEETIKGSIDQTSQQTSQVDESEETPFFMKQDRPKFSAQVSYVPASATSRAFQYGLLGVQLISGTVKEAIKQKIGLSEENPEQFGKSGFAKYAINQSNANKLQQNFRKMRGAVLKLGQILSTGEQSVVPPVIREAMEKARSEADIMPIEQVMKILEKEYGQDWQKRFREINLYPFAAASIGQVHEAILKNGMRVALKMQYTGVADSIDSDLNNFKRLVSLFGFPRGLFLNELIETTRGELYWETDYLREAQMQIDYASRLLPYPKDYYTPKVIEDMTTKHLLCTEFVDGVEVDTLTNQPQEVRNRAGTLMLRLCFKELFEWKIMQTDPNPANYLYDVNKSRLNLIDFGSGRIFDDRFLDGYMNIIHGAFIDNRDQVMSYSRTLGFLTGEENKEMLNAHYQGVSAMAEPFKLMPDGIFDFGNQTIMKKINEAVPTMSKHRLTPPPKEIYSLHRKIVGTYLMCMKLRAKVYARDIFIQTHENWLKTQRKL